MHGLRETTILEGRCENGSFTFTKKTVFPSAQSIQVRHGDDQYRDFRRGSLICTEFC